jgi:hypothetical protein
LDRYVASLRVKQVQPTAVRWHVIRAEHSLQAMSPKRLAEHTSQDVTDYLEKLGRIGRLTDWQYGQTVAVIQHLCLLGEVARTPQFDWAFRLTRGAVSSVAIICMKMVCKGSEERGAASGADQTGQLS